MVAELTPETPLAVRRSVSLPADLAAEVDERTDRNGFSAIVAEALEHWIAMAKLREVVADNEAHGHITDADRRWAEEAWDASA
ncbi:hypothetical protein ACFVVX_01010 [Kitasatospora sp. NPDC058170]|uniref:hypothetical protein n=1 Tax=Kitasatospora sp. NPDC058170 TaxID=3346364 RepID=UPI0036DAA30D